MQTKQMVNGLNMSLTVTLAALFALPPFYFSVTNCHVNIYIDDITPVAFVNSIAIFGSQ